MNFPLELVKKAYTRNKKRNKQDKTKFKLPNSNNINLCRKTETVRSG